MCIAILNTKGKLSKETFNTCWGNNPDGAGIAWAEDGVVHTYKEMKSPKAIYKKYSEVRKRLPNNNMLIHFRIATHGRVNETNCHPFKVNNKLAFVHNGMIDGNGLTKSTEFSDTYLFNQLFLQKLPKDFINNDAILNLMSEYIGYSKLIFLDAKDNWAIVNENLGEWDGDNWYSNDSYIADRVKTCSVGKTNYYDNYEDWYDVNASGKVGDEHVEYYCECCDEEMPSRYVREFSAYMCDKCIKDFAEDDIDDIQDTKQTKLW